MIPTYNIDTGWIAMPKWDKPLDRICSLSKGLRFEELQKVLESFWVCDERSQRRQQALYVLKAEISADYHTKPSKRLM